MLDSSPTNTASTTEYKTHRLLAEDLQRDERKVGTGPHSCRIDDGIRAAAVCPLTEQTRSAYLGLSTTSTVYADRNRSRRNGGADQE
jgi:hypothetical protein